MIWEFKRFEELDIDELYDILKARNEVFVVEQKCPYQDCDGRDMHSWHLIGKDSKGIVAYLRIIEKGIAFEDVAIGRVLVVSGERGKGYARHAMQEAIRFVSEKLEEACIRIQAQAYLVSFYESLGFQTVSGEYLEDGIPHVDMTYNKEI